MKRQTPSGSNDDSELIGRTVTSAWRYALATIAALEKERRLPKPSAHAGDERPAPDDGPMMLLPG